MNVSRVALMRCIIRGARENNPTDPKAALTGILKSRFASEVTNGTTIVSTSSDGHAVSFALLDSHPSQRTLRLVRRTHPARGGRY